MKRYLSFIILLVSPFTIFASQDSHITCNNYNQHTIIQSIAGKDGVILKHVSLGSSSDCHSPLGQHSDSPSGDNNPSSATHIWTIENNQHFNQHADQSTRTLHDPFLPDETIPHGITPLPEIYAQNSSSSPAMHFLSKLIQPKMIAGTIGIVYSAILVNLLYTAHVVLKKKSTWVTWNESVTNENLSHGNAALAKELYTDIQNYYANQKESALFLTPLVNFINDVDAQISTLEQFIKIHRLLAYYKVSILFPAHKKELAQAEKSVKRLELLKNFVIKSIREYKTV